MLATTLASFGWLIFTLVGGWLSDKIGRVKTFLIGYGIVFAWMIPMFVLIDTKDIVLYGMALFVLTIGLGLSYGPMSAMYAEMFPAHVRYSGISIGYAFGAILGGAFAPLIAEALLETTKWTGSIGIYIMVLCVISAVGVILAKETRGRPLGFSATTSPPLTRANKRRVRSIRTSPVFVVETTSVYLRRRYLRPPAPAPSSWPTTSASDNCSKRS